MGTAADKQLPHDLGRELPCEQARTLKPTLLIFPFLDPLTFTGQGNSHGHLERCFNPQEQSSACVPGWLAVTGASPAGWGGDSPPHS